MKNHITKSLRILIMLCAMFIWYGNIIAQPTIFQNPSLEGPPSPHITPHNWDICQPGTTPDTQPGSWGITLPPSDGNSYLGLVYSTSQKWHEGASQQLSVPLVAGTLYYFYIDLATTNTTQGGIQPGCVELQLYGNMGGNGGCDTSYLLWSSGNVTSLTWQKYNVSFTPSQSFTNLLFLSHGLGCSDQPYIMMDNISSSLGLDKYGNSLGIEIYPNPVAKVLNIECKINNEPDISCEIYNSKGTLVLEKSFAGDKTQIDVSNLAKGLYLLKVENEDGVTVRRFVKE